MKILFLTQFGESAASSRTRAFQYVPYLAREGHEVRVLPLIPDAVRAWSKTLEGRQRIPYCLVVGLLTILRVAQTVLVARSYDVLIVQKVILPRTLAAILGRVAGKVVYDFDDAIQTLLGWKRRMFPNILRTASLVVVENDQNMRAAAKYCPQVVKIVGPIDTQLYHPAPIRDSDGPLVIGWIGSPDTAEYLRAVHDVLRDLARTHALVFRTIGSGPQKIQGVQVETFEWSLEDEVELLQSFDIGIGPLPDNEWTRGKAGYKLLQYMAVGIPVVASPIGEHGKIVVHGSTGYHATSAAEWRQSLASLMENADLRTMMGHAGRIRAEQAYSFEVATKTLLAELTSFMTRRGNRIDETRGASTCHS